MKIDLLNVFLQYSYRSEGFKYKYGADLYVLSVHQVAAMPRKKAKKGKKSQVAEKPTRGRERSMKTTHPSSPPSSQLLSFLLLAPMPTARSLDLRLLLPVTALVALLVALLDLSPPPPSGSLRHPRTRQIRRGPRR